MARSAEVAYPRSQVSVYRTLGPLVSEHKDVETFFLGHLQLSILHLHTNHQLCPVIIYICSLIGDILFSFFFFFSFFFSFFIYLFFFFFAFSFSHKCKLR